MARLGGGDFNLGDIDWNQDIPSSTNPTTAAQHNKFMHIYMRLVMLSNPSPGLAPPEYNNKSGS